MSVTKLKGSNKRSGLCKLALDGDMTIYTAQATHAELKAFVDDFKKFEVDLTAVEEIDSTGMQTFMSLEKSLENNEKTLTFTGLSDSVEDVFRIYQMKDWLEQAGVSL